MNPFNRFLFLPARNSGTGGALFLLPVLLLAVLLISCRRGAEIPGTSPALSAVDSLIRQEISRNSFPGAVVQIKKGDSVIHRAARGDALKYDYHLQPVTDPEPMTTSHLFDLASLTKVVGTTTGIMLLADRGEIALDEPVHTYLPEFEGGEKTGITVRHLLTHTAGLVRWVPVYYHADNSADRYRYIAGLPLRWEAGASRHYSDLGFMLLGEIIERISGRTLERFLEEQLFRVLGLHHTAFNPIDRGFEKIAATSHGNPFERQMVYDDDFGYRVDVDPESWNGWREYTLRGEVNDGNAWYAGGGVAGHAGLFSTVDDLQVLVDMLIAGGRFEGRQLISPAVIDTFLTGDRRRQALGWSLDPGFISAEDAPAGTFGHTGFTGTSIVIVPRHKLSVILLTNRQHAGRQDDGYYFNLGPLRQAILDEALKAVAGDTGKPR